LPILVSRNVAVAKTLLLEDAARRRGVGRALGAHIRRWARNSNLTNFIPWSVSSTPHGCDHLIGPALAFAEQLVTEMRGQDLVAGATADEP
jgi:GNAT superfamily N-acetyltransferase